MKMKIRNQFWIILFFLLAGTTAWAQPTTEFSFTLGWTFSDGVTGDPILAGDGNIYDQIDPKDAFSWGFTGDYSITDNFQVGFWYGRQESTLEISGTTTREIDDLKVDSYHGVISYNFTNSEAMVRPFVFGGIGATSYGETSFLVNGTPRVIDGATKFSTTFGAGVKFYATDTIGFRVDARWTPTNVKSDAEGWWCDPFWGCYVVTDAQYANQIQMGGGVTFRF